MVKDGYSDNGQGSAVADRLDRNSSDPLLGSPVGSLTQELAQLLAALIAQNQTNKGGAPTNTELTSLANLVSAATARRTIPPVSKDGLSTLSYTQPATAPPLEPGHDDEPLPIPSTWREPLARDDDRWFHQQMCATVLGLIAGLMIVVPAVLWLSGFFSPQRSETSASRAADARSASATRFAEVKTARVPVRPTNPARPAERLPESEAQFAKESVEQSSPAPVEAKSPPMVPIITAARTYWPQPGPHRWATGAGHPAYRERRRHRRTRLARRRRRRRAGRGLFRPRGDLRSKHAGGLGDAWRGC